MFEKDGYCLRRPQAEDAENYWSNFDPFDPDVSWLTGTNVTFAKDQVLTFFHKCLTDPDRRDFLIISPHGEIVGESVINEIDWETRSANFRIAIFQHSHMNKGIGTWVVKRTRDYAFQELKLHRLSLSVYSFNPRAKHVYEKAGFRTEGILRDAILGDGNYADEILMAILESEWQNLRDMNV